MDLRMDQKLYYTTVKIINYDFNGAEHHSTGFLFNFNLSNGKILRTIITCKHCIKNFAKLDLVFCKDNGAAEPIDTETFTLSCNQDSIDFIVYHPNDDIDLVAIIFSYDKRIFIPGHTQPFYLSLDETVVPNENVITSLQYIEEVIMVGYPQGIWDTYNNKPIIRRGVTATPVQLDFQNKKEFLIDIAAFHGSSGSPVFIFNNGMYATQDGVTIGNRVYLLGMLYGGWEEVKSWTTSAKISLPPNQEFEAKIKLPNNLGVVLKTSVILELLPLLEKRICEILPQESC